MRQAPKWRRSIPTSRQLRFAVQSHLASRWPSVGQAFNFFPAEATRQDLERSLTLRWVEESHCSLPDDRTAFLEAFGALEQARYPLPITQKGRAEISVYRLGRCYVLGHSGATILIHKGLQLQSLAHNTAKFKRLRTRSVQGTCINRLGMRRGHRHYYHFMMDGLFPLIRALEKLGTWFPKVTLLVRPDLAPFQRAAYARLLAMFPHVQLETVADDERIHCDELLHIDEAMNCEYRAPASERAIETLSGFFKTAYDLPSHGAPRRWLYLSRADAKIRHILNEAEIIQHLKPFGFEVICPGKMSHQDQIKVFAEAQMIVGSHGAALSNLVFTQPGQAHVVELFASDYVQSAYMWLATLKGQRYTPILCGPSQTHQHFDVPEVAISRLMGVVQRKLDSQQVPAG